MSQSTAEEFTLPLPFLPVTCPGAMTPSVYRARRSSLWDSLARHTQEGHGTSDGRPDDTMLPWQQGWGDSGQSRILAWVELWGTQPRDGGAVLHPIPEHVPPPVSILAHGEWPGCLSAWHPIPQPHWPLGPGPRGDQSLLLFCWGQPAYPRVRELTHPSSSTGEEAKVQGQDRPPQ